MPALTLPHRNQKNSTNHLTSEIRTIVAQFLDTCDVPYTVISPDPAFSALCFSEALARNLPLDPIPGWHGASLRAALPKGISIATTSYGHLPSTQTRVFIALIAALLFVLDDHCNNATAAARVARFNEYWVKCKPQGDAHLDALASVLREVYDHYEPMEASIIVPSLLNFINAVALEWEADTVELSPDASEFPSFMRIISGGGEACAIFGFPPEIPLKSYLHVLPDMRLVLNNMNDVLSYYKEHLAGDSGNQIAVRARLERCSEVEILRNVAEGVLDAHRRVVAVLGRQKKQEGAQSALEVYMQMFRGNVIFHTSEARYRLSELFEY